MRIRHQGPSLVVDAPAKVNLHLKVLGRRPDGFHELETVMVSIGLFDTLRFDPQPMGGLSLQTHHALPTMTSEPPIEWLPAEDNLVIKAAQALRNHTGTEHGAQITLVKRIPWQAGLGGGSSDAAAALLALNRVWSLNLSRAELHRLAASLGSDLNFFLDSIPLGVCRGRGEQIEAVPLNRRMAMTIVKPPSGLSTAEVFRNLSSFEDGASSDNLLEQLCCPNSSGAGSVPLKNDLQEPAQRLNPDVDQTLTRLREMTHRPVCMTGSGTACFTICRTQREAVRLAARWNAGGFGRAFPVETCL